jgi:hypothetical protein
VQVVKLQVAKVQVAQLAALLRIVVRAFPQPFMPLLQVFLALALVLAQLS